MEQISFSVDKILAEAREKSGLQDFGDPRFRDGLEVLAQTFDQNLKDETTRQNERRQLINWLMTRLRIQDTFRRHPEILGEEVVAPMFVTGLPRSGTSALFNLLNSDPDARALLLWEATFPEPLEGLEPGQADPRYLAMKEYMEANRDPELDKVHYTHPDLPEECVLLQCYSFDGALRGWEITLEPYSSWFQGHALDYLYEEQLRHMKLLQWQRPGKRWLVKAPSHLWDIKAILRSFPDASIVWGHRDPVAVIPSICSLQLLFQERSLGKLEGDELNRYGQTVMNWYAESLERALRARSELGEEHFLDYGFREFVDDPRAVVDRIYQHFKLSLSPATERALLEHMRKNKKGQHGVHEYSLEAYGLSEQQVRQRFDFYLDHPLI